MYYCHYNKINNTYIDKYYENDFRDKDQVGNIGMDQLYDIVKEYVMDTIGND